MEIFVAKQLGKNDEVNELYLRSKNNLEKEFEKRRKTYEEKDYETADGISGNIISLQDDHAKICEIMGDYEEAMNARLDAEINEQVLLEEPYTSILDKKHRKSIYEIFINNISDEYDFITVAKAAEKLGRKKEELEYYQKALEDYETSLFLSGAFTIAKKLNLEQKVKTYTDIITYLYEKHHLIACTHLLL